MPESPSVPPRELGSGYKSWILAVLALCVLSTFANAELGAAPNPEPARNSMAAAREVAARVYDAAETGQDVEVYVAAVLEAFGIKAFGPEKLSTAAVRLPTPCAMAPS
jgi:hypothetical protein